MRNCTITVLCFVALSVFASSPVAAQRASDTDVGVRRETIGAVAPDNAHPGDILRVRIWREPDMSGDFPVDAGGTATLPRLGALRVVDIPSDSLERLLVAEYARFLRNPSVEVTLLRRVRVVGEVRSPGLYTADPTMGLRDILALAGGPSSDGRTDRVRLDRGGESMWLALTDAPPGNEARLRSGDQLFVPQRSWFARNTPIVASVAASVAGAIIFAVTAR